MILLNLFQLLLLVPLALAVPAAKSTPKSSVTTTASGSATPTAKRAKVTMIPIHDAGGFTEVVNYNKTPPALLKQVGQAQNEANEKANAKSLESISGGFWGKNTGSSSADKGLPAQPKAPVATKPKPIAKRAPKGLIDCLLEMKVYTYIPTSGGWALVANPYNERIKTTPDVVVMAKEPLDVARAVVCATEYNYPVQARAGGHSYAGFSSGTVKGVGMVIDLRFMDVFKYNRRSKEAVVEAGIRLGNLALNLLEADSRAISHGDCPGVGLAGHALHGGFGYTSRMWGLSTDAITGLDVVMADGTTIFCSESQYSDIFWGMRGAANSIGIAVRIYLATEPAPPTVVHFTYNMPDFVWNNDPQEIARTFYNTQVTAQSPDINEKTGLTIRIDSGTYRVAGYYYGRSTETAFKRLISSLNSATGRIPDIEVLTYAESLSSISQGSAIRRPPDNNNLKSDFFAKSLLVPERSAPSLEALTKYFSYVLDKGAKVRSQWIFTYRLMGGAGSVVRAKGDAWSAVSNRRSLWVVQHDGFSDRNPRDVRRFVEGSTQAFQSTDKGAAWNSFLPFVDPSMTPLASHQAYYSPRVLDRLFQLKGKYDKKDIFHNAHTLALAQ